ncbi:hypothetical protein P7C71_g155, partial [Lecanoromycetidae sp. Uapishka_2]
MIDISSSLINPVAKLDIKDLLEGSPSPSSRTTHPPQVSRSISVPSTYPYFSELPSPSSTSTASYYSAPTAPPNSYNHHRQHSRDIQPQPTARLSTTSRAVFEQNLNLNPAAVAPAKRRLGADDQPSGSPARAKKSQKWSPTENAEIIRLRGGGMKWDDISKRIPGRSPISCRLHYQNYLEKRSEWNEEQRDKLARVYDRLKPDLWAPIANELGIPWRACEAMHWTLGEQDMARRANAEPFKISATAGASGALTDTMPGELGLGRVAQRDRMLESTRVFEGRDLTALGGGSEEGGFCSMGGNGNGLHGVRYSLGGDGYGVNIPPIKDEGGNYSSDDEMDDDEGDDEEEEGPRVRRRGAGGEVRLPGFAELNGEIEAFAERGGSVRVKIEGEEKRRGSG